MPIYKYKGVDYDGKKIRGVEQCNDEIALRVSLRNAGILLESFKVVKEKRRSSFLSVSSKVSPAQFLSFCQQLSIMLKAGVPIKLCLESLRAQSFTTYFKNIISDVYEDVVKGVYLSEALKKHKKVFPSYFCSLVYVGELSGELADVLTKAAAYYEADGKVKRKVKSSMIYPCFLFVIVVAVFFGLMLFVVPSFKEMIEANNGKLPFITVAVMAVSDFIKDNIIAVLGTIVGVVLACFIFFKTKIGKITKGKILNHLPIIKNVTRNSMTSRFCSSLSILLDSGMQVLDCMMVMPTIIDDPYFTEKFTNVVKDLNHGRKLSKALEKTTLFPPMLVQMTAVGETASSLPEVYDKVGDYFTDVLNASISRATGMLEPIVIVLLGIVVLVVLLAVYLPMFSLMESFGV